MVLGQNLFLFSKFKMVLGQNLFLFSKFKMVLGQNLFLFSKFKMVLGQNLFLFSKFKMVLGQNLFLFSNFKMVLGQNLVLFSKFVVSFKGNVGSSTLMIFCRHGILISRVLSWQRLRSRMVSLLKRFFIISLCAQYTVSRFFSSFFGIKSKNEQIFFIRKSSPFMHIDIRSSDVFSREMGKPSTLNVTALSVEKSAVQIPACSISRAALQPIDFCREHSTSPVYTTPVRCTRHSASSHTTHRNVHKQGATRALSSAETALFDPRVPSRWQRQSNSLKKIPHPNWSTDCNESQNGKKRGNVKREKKKLFCHGKCGSALKSPKWHVFHTARRHALPLHNTYKVTPSYVHIDGHTERNWQVDVTGHRV